MSILNNRLTLIRNAGLFLLLLTFVSCDPAQTLLISNETDADATVTVVFKKGDSHQALFDMCASSDFIYNNYPALSPSSNWIQSNFGLGRRGFVLEQYNGTNFSIKPFFN